jgi:predicted RNA-binding protein YlxR (DUF448 family)
VTPIRTCVGCGQRSPQTELIRFVAGVEGTLELDGGRRAGGRGAYLHADAACWRSFAGRRGPIRSLRANPSRPARVALCEALDAARCGGRVERRG